MGLQRLHSVRGGSRVMDARRPYAGPVRARHVAGTDGATLWSTRARVRRHRLAPNSNCDYLT
jgi:hypothetical protein